MDILKIFFFHIYNSYYNNGNYRNDVPHWTAFRITACAMTCWIVALLSIVVNLMTGKRLTPIVLYPVCFFSLIYFFYNFLFRGKYQIIYAKIIGGKWDNKFMKYFSWIFIMSGFISIGLYAYIFNQK